MQEYDYYVGSPAQPFKVMLDWTDAPGSLAAAKALVNDLDLVVIAPDGTTYNGNVFNGAFSVAGGSSDHLNNTEGIYLTSPITGTYRVLVRGYEVPQGPQGYALTVLGSTSPPPPLTPIPGQLTMLNDTSITPTVSYNLKLQNTSNTSVDWQASLGSGIAGLSLSGPTSGTLAPSDSVTLVLVLDLRQTEIGTTTAKLTIASQSQPSPNYQQLVALTSIYTGPDAQLNRLYLPLSIRAGPPGW
jgi:hypothetical protein